jgi:hypothetical protein
MATYDAGSIVYKASIDTKGLKDDAGKVDSVVKGLSSTAKGASVAIASAMAVGVAGIAGLTTKMLTSSAELEQQIGGTEAVFGDFASSIQNTAKSAYQTMGLSQSEFLAGANKMASLYQGAGISVKDSMDMSAGAIQRATDVASIMGIDTATALESVTAMAKGNYTMMDNLGVAMNDTALNAYALEKGIGKTTAQMTAGEKNGLAYQMFMEKTAKYAGNYAKENETLAGSLNTTKKAFDDFMSGSGSIENFIDSLVNTIEIGASQIVVLLPKLVSGIGQLATGVMPVLASILPTLIPEIINSAIALVDALINAMPTIIDAL